MKIYPIQPTIPFLMRFKNTDTETTKQQPNNGNTGFKQAMKDAECQPIKPTFTGHWPQYTQHNFVEGGFMCPLPVIPTDIKGNGGKLNFIV